MKLVGLYLLFASSCTAQLAPEPHRYAERNSGLGYSGSCEGVGKDAIGANIPFSMKDCLDHTAKPKFKIGEELVRDRSPERYRKGTKIKVKIGRPVYARYWSTRRDDVGRFEKAYLVSIEGDYRARIVPETELVKMQLSWYVEYFD